MVYDGKAKECHAAKDCDRELKTARNEALQIGTLRRGKQALRRSSDYIAHVDESTDIRAD